MLLLKIIITIVIVVVPVWLGMYGGFRYRRMYPDAIDHSPIGSVVGAALGLFAFMLAFTFQLTASRFDARKELLMEEVNAMRSVWMKADLLKDSNRIPVKILMKEYVDLHIRSSGEDANAEERMKRGKEIQDSIWAQTVMLAQEERSSETYSMFTSTVDEMIQLLNKRKVVGLHYRIPPLIFTILYFIAFFSMAILGFQFGVAGKGNLMITLSLAVIFSAVMLLIFALDDATMGILKVNEQQVYDLRDEMKSWTP